MTLEGLAVQQPPLVVLRAPTPLRAPRPIVSLLAPLVGLSFPLNPPLVPPRPPSLSPLTAAMATIDMRGPDSAGGGSSGKSHYDLVAAAVPGAAGVASGMDDDFSYGTSVGTSDKYVRLQFLRKVYTILSLQLAMTVGVAGLFMLADPVRHFVLAAQGPMTIVGMIATFGFLFGLMATKDQHPMNLYMLAGFTAAESYMVGTICAMYAERGIGDLVLEAFGLTMLVFVSLTVYCFVSKRDFSFLGGFLFAGLLIILGASVLNFLFGLGGAENSTFGFAISVGGALLFTGYILYDTSVIMNQLGPDEWALAAVNLYVRGLCWCWGGGGRLGLGGGGGTRGAYLSGPLLVSCVCGALSLPPVGGVSLRLCSTTDFAIRLVPFFIVCPRAASAHALQLHCPISAVSSPLRSSTSSTFSCTSSRFFLGCARTSAASTGTRKRGACAHPPLCSPLSPFLQLQSLLFPLVATVTHSPVHW